MKVSSSAMLGKVPRRRRVRAGRAEHPLSGEPPTNTQKLEEDFREEGNVLGYGRSCEHGGNRAFRCSAGGERAASAGKVAASAGQGAGSAAVSAGQGAGSAAIHAISGRTAGTAGSPGEPAASWAAITESEGRRPGENAGSDSDDGTNRAD